MYHDYWGLRQIPFGTAAGGAALLASSVHNEALARLDFLHESKSPLGLLLGAGGSGKSFVFSEFAKRAQRKGSPVALVSAAGSDHEHLLSDLAAGLGFAATDDARQLWLAAAERTEELKLEGLRALVMVDDLDRAAASAQAVVERLLALPDPPLTIVASARPETAARLSPRLVERAALRIDLAPWNETETREYVKFSLAHAGRQAPAFNDASVRRLFELSGGAVRKVNQLAQLALLVGASQKLAQIDAHTIEAVQEELSVH